MTDSCLKQNEPCSELEEDFMIIEDDEDEACSSQKLDRNGTELQNSSLESALAQSQFIPSIEFSRDFWKVMIVDDDLEVHQATRLALGQFTFAGRSLKLISAHSGEEAKRLITAQPDIAFILLDVVMETNDAGLQVVQYIRKTLQNQLVRIILRTGQPGDEPEESILLNYDINDYKLKVDLTYHKLIATTIATLRSYQTLLQFAQQSQELRKTLDQLQHTQLALVQSEKMASLGNLMTGIAHEINNPIGFLNGSITNGKDYVQDLFGHLALYQKHYPNSIAPIQANAEKIDLEFLREDLPKLLDSMQGAADRIATISNSLRTFSRSDTEYTVSANLHDGLDSTLLILKYRLKANEHRPAIEIIQDYGDIPTINCFPGQLNQVFMNILANAIDMFDEMAQTKSFDDLQSNPQQITIRTTIDSNHVQIRISDNGKGMMEEVQARIFDHLFTTKGVGKGTGLGLAIARQIVVEKHGGSLEVQSEVGKGTEFCIRLPIVS